ncbi:NUDIX hydrolase [Butyrivibrio sp. AE2032]|uniref:NUDIX hydrolase n=1 Tax=Butyrivibrio sp. AE2032 TaxID=1458463 RepID=UPI0005564D50|nr:NUDIX domain-containing protein [Butyrivibrio sp. AE2032]
MRIENLTTLIYITRGSDCLFIRKTRKGDMNLDKYLGIGGHFESDESPEECVLRELKEEAAIEASSLNDFRYRGLITFISSEYPTEYMHVFSASVPLSFELPEQACDEGELCWVPLSDIKDLPIWEGDKIMFDYLFGESACSSFFTMKFRYEGDRLAGHEEKCW